MKNFKKLITTLSKKNNENLFHIFLIPNQTSAIVTRLIISVLDLKKNNYLFVDSRYSIQAKIESGDNFRILNIHEKLPKNYFKNELLNLKSMEEDGLSKIRNDRVVLTDIGKDFVQNIMNIFDKYDPPSKNYQERLLTIKKAKEKQSKLISEFI